MDMLPWMIGGVIAGFLAGQVMRGGGYGLIGDIIVGVLGGMLYRRCDVGDQLAVDPDCVRRSNTVDPHTPHDRR